MAFTDLNEPERLLCRAFPRGTWVDLRAGDPVADDVANAAGWGQDREIRAEVIRALLLGGGDVQPGYAPGIRLRGARVTGRLDLMGATVAYPLVCEYCCFTGELRLVEASTRTIRIIGSQLPAFNGTRMRTDGIVNLWTSSIASVLRLDHAKLSGQLSLGDATIGAGSEALSAFGIAIDGSLEGAGLNARGSVVLEIASITGSVELAGARISRPGHRALVMDRAVIGKLDCRGMVVQGQTRLHNARIGASIAFAAATLDNPGDVAMSAGGLTVGGGFFFTEGFTATGEMRLYGAQLAANLTLSAATIKNPGGTALNLTRASVGVFNASGLRCEGQLNLISARVASDVDLADSHLTESGGRPVLAADRATVDGAFVLAGLRARGEVSLRTLRVGQRVILRNSRLENPDGIALRLSRAQVAADVFCHGMTCTGTVRVSGASIGGELNLNGARIRSAAGVAIDAAGLTAGELSLLLAEPPQGLVDLRHAHLGILRDDPACWPDKLSLDGLTYETLEPVLRARHRLRWLARDPSGYQPRRYERLAAHYTTIGQPSQARQVMYASERDRRRAKTPLARAWSLVQDIAIGYGYQPWRAVAWLAIFLTAGSVIFAVTPPPPLTASAAPHFNSVVYTLDLLLPVVDLGQKHAFNPAGAEQWFSYLLIAAGWILVSTIAAGAARVVSRR